MMESPFQVTHQILTEIPNVVDELRIIAKDGGRLDAPKRELIASAADELETAYKALIQLHAQLIETQRRLIAVNEQLIEARKVALPKPKSLPFMSLSSGWIPVITTP